MLQLNHSPELRLLTSFPTPENANDPLSHTFVPLLSILEVKILDLELSRIVLYLIIYSQKHPLSCVYNSKATETSLISLQSYPPPSTPSNWHNRHNETQHVKAEIYRKIPGEVIQPLPKRRLNNKPIVTPSSWLYVDGVWLYVHGVIYE